MCSICVDRYHSWDVNLTLKTPYRTLALLWVLGLIAGVAIGAAVAFGVAGNQASVSQTLGLGRAA